jgi:hypothetical protein
VRLPRRSVSPKDNSSSGAGEFQTKNSRGSVASAVLRPSDPSVSENEAYRRLVIRGAYPRSHTPPYRTGVPVLLSLSPNYP